MTQTPPARKRPTPPDPARVRERIEFFLALEASDARAFAEHLADNVMEPDAAETEALRSEELAVKSYTAARYLIENTHVLMRSRRRGSDEYKRTERFIIAIRREERLLNSIVEGQRARHGILPTAPNPRGRAMRRLASENIKGDVKKGRFRELMIEEQEIDKERARAQKEARKQARRARRAGGST